MKTTSHIVKQAAEQKSATTNLDRQIHNYLDFLRLEKNLSPNTLTSYKFDFSKYRGFLISAGIQTASAVSEEIISKFLTLLHREYLSPRSVARIIGIHLIDKKEFLTILQAEQISTMTNLLVRVSC
jgi:site-specific recombinase XerD